MVQVLPELVCTIRNCEDGLREFCFWQLGSLVSIVRQVGVLSLLSQLLSMHNFFGSVGLVIPIVTMNA